MKKDRFHLLCYIGDEGDLGPNVSEQHGGPVSRVWLGVATVTTTTTAKMSVT